MTTLDRQQLTCAECGTPFTPNPGTVQRWVRDGEIVNGKPAGPVFHSRVCAARNAARHHRNRYGGDGNLRERKRAAGVCFRCPNPVKPGFQQCDRCLALTRQRERERRQTLARARPVTPNPLNVGKPVRWQGADWVICKFDYANRTAYITPTSEDYARGVWAPLTALRYV